MKITLKNPPQVVVAFAFDVEKTEGRASGFKPADDHLGSDEPNPLYGQPRLEGYAAMLRLGFAKRMIIPGKDERRYKGETVWQGWAIKKMLVLDYGCNADSIEWVRSSGSTDNAAIAARQYLEANHIPVSEGVVEFSTSYYHALRTIEILRECGLPACLKAAEAFTVAECMLQSGQCDQVIDRLRSFGGHYTDPRILKEIKGLAKKLLESYETQRHGW